METVPSTAVPITPSPFLPGTPLQYVWDSTSLGWLKECPRKYQYSMIEGWRSQSESVHLKFGLIFHSALELFDKEKANGASVEDATDAVLLHTLEETWDREAGAPWASDHTKKNRDTLVRSILWYLDAYADDVAQTVILADGKPAVELSFKVDTGIPAPLGGTYILSGHMDRLVNFGEEIYVMDRKTTGSTISPYFFDGFSPDNQMTLYTLAGKIIYNMPVAGVLIDAAQIAVGFTSFARGLTMRSDAQLTEYLKDFFWWTSQAERYAEAGYWPMNEKSCGNYGGCVFRKVCSQSPQVRPNYLKTYFTPFEWNPLVAR